MNKRQRKKNIAKKLKHVGGWPRYKAIVQAVKRFDCEMKARSMIDQIPEHDEMVKDLQRRIYAAMVTPISELRALGYFKPVSVPITIRVKLPTQIKECTVNITV